ncbi:MAG: 2-C-methyl-D-erythritol 2,4-cyclodiphosphate synthase [Clostridiaceae bacterium]|nr:2-C-methyl-D-erythritol 2,4-cyclodiphosphate synthase [Clostridiaceae bacterium]
MRIGHGYDVHRLTEDRPLVLGGVTIPSEYGLLGHSDADVLTHAVMDALLGAAGLPDIGQQFPDRDPAYAGISSLLLLARVMELIESAGYAVVNVDATVLAQKPRLAPHIPAMKDALASVLGTRAVNVKATTEEGLGFTGQGLGIAAHAVALLEERT